MSSIFNTGSTYTKIALIGLGSFILAIILLVAVVRPQWSALKKTGSEISAEQSKNKTTRTDLDNLKAANEFFKNNREQVELVTTALPGQPDVPTILTQLSELAKQNGVALTSFVPAQVQSVVQNNPADAAPAGVQSVEISANYNAKSFSDLQNYFFELERSLRIVDVKSISTTVTKGNQVGNQEGSVVFRAYYVGGN